jgi:hypothetical protein
MKKNLAVYVLFHTQYELGKNTYSYIYKLLCLDADHLFEDSLDIPVYLQNGDFMPSPQLNFVTLHKIINFL